MEQTVHDYKSDERLELNQEFTYWRLRSSHPDKRWVPGNQVKYQKLGVVWILVWQSKPRFIFIVWIGKVWGPWSFRYFKKEFSQISIKGKIFIGPVLWQEACYQFIEKKLKIKYSNQFCKKISVLWKRAQIGSKQFANGVFS